MPSGMGIPYPESFFIKVCIDLGMSNWYFEITEFSVCLRSSVFVACYGRDEMLLLMPDLEVLSWCVQSLSLH